MTDALGPYSYPKWDQNYIPTAGEWQSWWSNKVDQDGLDEAIQGVTQALGAETTAREEADQEIISSLGDYIKKGQIGSEALTILGSSNAIALSSAIVDIPVEAYGVTHDPSGQNVGPNTAAYMSALKATAGVARLVHRSGLTVVTNLIAPGSLSGVHWRIDGLIKLAPGANTSVIDISGWTDFIINGNGTIDGNRQNQSGGYPAALGGIISNVSGTQDTSSQKNSLGNTITVPPMPVAPVSALPVSDGAISGITIQNVFNWPISLGFITRVRVVGTTLCNSNSSPQFFQSAVDCRFDYNHCFNIDDAGFVFYRGNQRCGASGNNIHDCNVGLGVYAEYDMLPLDAFITIENNMVWNNADSGIGVTTGLTPPALMQQRIIITNNMLLDNNRSGRAGGGSIGIVGAQGVLVRGNMVFGDGSTATTNTSYSIFVDSQSAFIVIDGNQIADCGSAAAGGYGIWMSGANNCSVTNNTGYNTQGANGPMKALLAGSLGAGCDLSGNRPLGNLASSWDQMFKPASLPYQQRREADGRYAVSLGLSVASGDLLIESGLLALSDYYGATAQGTTQATAQAFNQQMIVVTSAASSAGVILPQMLVSGVEYTIVNRSGNDILIYPPVGGQIEGLGENTASTLQNTYTLKIFGFYSDSLPGGQWYGYKMPTANAAVN